jgi:hypothetical protein
MSRYPRSRPPMLARTFLLALALAATACTNEDPEPIASNCEDPDGCLATPQPLEKIDAVDILLVVDNSGSAADDLEAFKQQLPRLLNALVTGSGEDASFPPAASVHVGVVTSDMGLAGVPDIEKCVGLGDDGIFVRPNDAELSCERSYPGYLTFDGGPAALATVETVGCVPSLGSEGCGFEQPLEASLKALWPANDDTIAFATVEGQGARGHGGDGENQGFLRDDSLLVVVIVTDEDDDSTNDPLVHMPNSYLDPNNPEHAVLLGQGLNVRAALNRDRLYPVERYVAGLKQLHADHPDRVLFAAVAGFPADLLTPGGRALHEIEDDAERNQAYDALLADERMQIRIDHEGTEDPQDDRLVPSCDRSAVDPAQPRIAFPPVRLVNVARGFGRQGVLGSICSDDFGDATGMLLRAIGMRLTAAANGPADGGTSE